MSNLVKLLQQKQEELLKLVECTETSTKNAPEGLLRIACRKNAVQYYHKLKDDNRSGKSGRYIKRENRQLAYDLAQKDYDLAIYNAARKNLELIQKFLVHYHPHELEEIYEKMNPYRQAIVESRIITNKVFAEHWSSVKYRGKEFAEGVAEIYTNKGERVRSKSEKIIADMLFRAGIPYRYEYPIILQGMGRVYPDFTVLNVREKKEVYWEHFGMMDNPEYSEKALYKIDIYIKNNLCPGDQLIITHETMKRPLETGIIDKMIQSIE